VGEVVDYPAEQPDELRRPERLTPEHDVAGFDCGEAELNAWLRERAAKNEADGGSRTYIVSEGRVVVGFYCIANGSVMHNIATSKVRKNMPDPVPVMVIGRMAVAIDRQHQGIGAAMLRDAILRTLQAADIAGIRAILVHAKTDRAKEFYEKCGFRCSPVEPMTLMITISAAKRELGM
jgi:predicted N-acetyltransferase YhbS